MLLKERQRVIQDALGDKQALKSLHTHTLPPCVPRSGEHRPPGPQQRPTVPQADFSEVTWRCRGPRKTGNTAPPYPIITYPGVCQ